MKHLAFLLLALGATLTLSAQEIKYCGQTEQTEKLFQRFPQLHAHEAEAKAHETHVARKAQDEVYIIPTVFHIIHNNGAENISDEQVFDAMQVLNRDMRKNNADTITIIDQFIDIAADTHIEFRLAQLDPNGNCTNGINRVVSAATYDGDGDMKDLSRWPRNSYLNVWICADAAGAAGYSFLPGSVNNGGFGVQNDGIVMRHDYTGSIGTSNVTRSRTFTHEVGHWLNLRHPWGPGNSPGESGNCDEDDGVNDTPETIGWTSCTILGESCGSLDNIQNYMEYSYCTRMFTEGQADRMVDALTSSVAQRNQLWQDSNLEDTGVLNDIPVLCQAQFSVDRDIICVGDSVQFTDQSFNAPSSWEWQFGDGASLSGGEEVQNPSHTFNEPGEYTITLTVGNGIDEITTTEQAFITVMAPVALAAPIQEGFESDDWMDDWAVYNPTNDQGWSDTGAAAYSGSRSLRLSNNFTNNIDSFDWIESRPYDASEATEVTITYRWSYINRVVETDDRLRILVSGDCGQNWSTRELHRGFTDLPCDDPSNITWLPNSTSDWQQGTVVLDQEEFLTENLRIKFEFQAKGGNHIYLDDINISVTEPVSVNELGAARAEANVFPNPTGGNAQLQLDSEVADNARVQVLDAAGRLVFETTAWNVLPGKQTLELPSLDWPAGWYAVRISGQAVQARLPLIKQ